MRLSEFPCLALLILACSGGLPQVAAAAQSEPECRITKPNGIVAAGGEEAYGPVKESYGNTRLSLGPFGLWPEGTVVFRPGGAGFITPEGWLGMKFGWIRAGRERLIVEGRRLDGAAPPLRAESSHIDTDVFQASYLIFTTPGCWEVTARAGDASLTFVTKVVKIGEGPQWKREHRTDLSIVPAR